MKEVLFFVIFLLLIASCSNSNSNSEEKTYQYFFTGHCYQWGAPLDGRVDYRLEKMRLDTFDQIWLGGDLLANVPLHPQNIEYADSFFNLGSDRTHLAVGNHDVWDLEADFSLIENKTHRKTYYTTFFNGIALMVLNTTEFGDPAYLHKSHECETLEGQWNMIKNVTDTLQNVSHLVILHHHALLTNELAENKVDVQKIFNFYYPELNIGCEERGTFSELIYPRLMAIQKRGIQVILIGGDTGQQVKEFDFKTKEGITFLGSGLNNSAGTIGMPEYFNQSSDKILIFKHRPGLRKLEWEFRELEGAPVLIKK